MEVLSHPFRLRPNGTVATVTQGGDQNNAELLAVLILTRYGERELVPRFGLTDPVMFGITPTELAAQVAAYGPPVTITALDSAFTDPTTSKVLITFE